MSTLDVRRAYVLAGSSAGGEDASSPAEPPKILQLRLSTEALAQIIQGNTTSSPQGIAIIQPQGPDPRLVIGTEEYPIHYAAETGVNHLYHLSSSSTSGLDSVGSVSAKLTVRPDNVASSSSAASKLKESREAEQARKQGSRTVLLQDAPSTQKASAVKSSALKLRPKALATTNSPLIRSRAATPATNADEFKSLPGSPDVTAHTSETTPDVRARLQASSREGIEVRRQVIQLLAQGPLQRRQIVQDLPFSELQIAPVLDAVATAPDELQTSPNDKASKKYSGPVNRRNVSGPSPADGRSTLGSGPSTVYALSDESYRQVLVKDWRAFSPETKDNVSRLMAAALDRMGTEPYAPERAQITSQVKKLSGSLHAEKLDDISDADLSTIEAQTPSPEKPNLAKAKASRKPTTQDRLKRAAKGKAPANSNKRQTDSPSLTAKIVRGEGPSATKTTASVSAKALEDAQSVKLDSETEKLQDSPKSAAPAQKRKSESLLEGDAASRLQPRQRFEYTDSSDGEDSSAEDLQRARESRRQQASSKPSSRSTRPRPSQSVERHGVGRGATSQAEPWLDVQSARDWHELARRFQRIYADYQRDLRKLQSEEELLHAELAQAKQEETRAAERAASAKQSTEGSLLAPSKTESASKETQPDDDDEREEGEASPSMDRHPASFADVRDEHAGDSNIAFKWRQATLLSSKSTADNRAGGTLRTSAPGDASLSSSTSSLSSPAKAAARQSSSNSSSGPMPMEEMDLLVASIVDREDQLKRMRAALQSSKNRLGREQKQQHEGQRSRAIAV